MRAAENRAFVALVMSYKKKIGPLSMILFAELGIHGFCSRHAMLFAVVEYEAGITLKSYCLFLASLLSTGYNFCLPVPAGSRMIGVTAKHRQKVVDCETGNYSW